MASINQEFIKENPNSYVSLNLMNPNKTTWGNKKTQELYDLMNQESQSTKNRKSILKYIVN
jgi:hypothetical protein